MNIEEAIRSRRSIGVVKPDPVPRALVERLIEAAVWAPNHHRTEPWRFVVLEGEGRKRLGKAYADIAAATLGSELPEEERSQRLKKEEAKAQRAPVIIAAVAVPADLPRVVRNEELAAVHAAVQNLLLCAHANGLGAIWRTGDPVDHPAMKQALGLQPDEELVGLVYVGYPAIAPPEAHRIPASAKMVWIDC